HPSIDVIAQGPEVAQVGQPPSNAEIVGVIEGGLGAQGALLLEVLLDVAAFVGDMQTGIDPRGDHASREAAGRGPGNLAWKQQLHLVGAAEVEIVTNDAFEELPPAERPVEDLRAADCQL